MKSEYIQSSAVTPQSASVNFIVDRAGTLGASPTTGLLGSISGTLTYFGKIPFTVSDETVATYDGQTKLLSGRLSHSPVPGTVTVRDRDTMEQVRMPISELEAYIAKSCEF